VLQRRLASSTMAIYESIRRRLERQQELNHPRQSRGAYSGERLKGADKPVSRPRRQNARPLPPQGGGNNRYVPQHVTTVV
jgi:hypothetical protein